MVDWRKKLRTYLLAQASLVALTGQRIYASDQLPTGYKPSDGAAILIGMRSGGMDYTSQVLRIAAQFRIYAPTQAQIITADSTLFDVLNDAQSVLLSARLDVPGQQLTHPDTLWSFMLTFYQLHFQNTSTVC